MIDMKKITWLQKISADLCARAQRGKSAELYAEVFLDNLPPFVSEQEVAQRFQSPDAIAQLAQLNPNVAQFAPWFEEFRQHVIEILAGEEDLEEVPQGAHAANGRELGIEE